MVRLFRRPILLFILGLLLIGTALPIAAFARTAAQAHPATFSRATRGLEEEPEAVQLRGITGMFFKNTKGVGLANGAFDVSPGTQPVFTQRFPVIFFDPVKSLQTTCPTSTGVDDSTQPFTDVNLHDGCKKIIAQGNGNQAGKGNLTAFEAAFTAEFRAPSAGTLTVSITADDGWILAVGADQKHQPTAVSGPMTNAPTKSFLQGYTVVGAFNATEAPTASTVVINIPDAGTYPVELDYSENGVGLLTLTVDTTFKSTQQSGAPEDNPEKPEANPEKPEANPGKSTQQSGAPEANPGAPEANPGAPEANPGAPEANPGAPEANPGAPEANA